MKKVKLKQAQEAAKTIKTNKAKMAAVAANRDLQVSEIDASCSEETKPLEDEITQAESILAAYAEQNRDTLFPEGKKSMEFFGCQLGFKKTPAKLSLVGDSDWDAVLILLKKKLPDYVDVKESVDKKGIVKNAAEIGEKKLAALGVAVTQQEVFFVK